MSAGATTVRLPKGLRAMYDVPTRAEVGGATVAELFAALDESYPGVGHRLVDAGALRQHIIVFVGDQQSGLETAVPDGAEVMVVTAVAGG